VIPTHAAISQYPTGHLLFDGISKQMRRDRFLSQEAPSTPKRSCIVGPEIGKSFTFRLHLSTFVLAFTGAVDISGLVHIRENLPCSIEDHI
jgi:hypothetical protein